MGSLKGRTLSAAAALAVLIGVLTVPAPAATADPINAITPYIQAQSGCLPSRVGNLYCQGPIGQPILLSPGAEANAPIWNDTAYALCWTTSAGVTLPPGADCTATGSPIATGNNFAYSNASSFPVTFTGCEGWPNVQANSFLFRTGTSGPCSFTIVTPDAPGLSGTTISYTLQVGTAPVPVINGTLRVPTTGRYTSGRSTPLQSIDCEYNEEIGNLWVQCPGVTLNWAVHTGRRSCTITKITNTNSPSLGTVRVTFRKPGTCTVQGTYPAVEGRSTTYSTPVYTFTVTGGPRSN